MRKSIKDIYYKIITKKYTLKILLPMAHFVTSTCPLQGTVLNMAMTEFISTQFIKKNHIQYVRHPVKTDLNNTKRRTFMQCITTNEVRHKYLGKISSTQGVSLQWKLAWMNIKWQSRLEWSSALNLQSCIAEELYFYPLYWSAWH